MNFTDEEIGLILQSLEYTKRAFENYSDYPSYQFKTERINEVEELIGKFRQYKKSIKYGISRIS